MAGTNLNRFRAVVEAALAHLEARRREVNDLNVFPVADGDTGDNMVLTLKAVVSELDRLGERDIDEIGREEIVESVARAALLGARGNSGVILSQLIRGAAEELASRPGELVDPTLVGAAMARTADRAYASVRDPAEGTILTVVREMAHRIATELAHMNDSRLEPEASPERQDATLASVLSAAVEAGKEAVERTPEQLGVLREAGVVDAGGYALTVIFAGIVGALQGVEPPEVGHHAPPRVTHPQHHSATYRYCTNFAVSGRDLDPADFTARLEALGDSVLVVGDRSTLRVHVHTDEPDAATAVFDGVAEVSHLDVADMREQEAARTERLAGRNGAEGALCGGVAVCSGDGLRALFEGLGLHAIDGGPTLNPSTYDLLAGVHAVPAEEVVVLVNSPNVVMAAERAAELSDKRVAVVRSRTMQAGLAAAVSFDPDREASANAAAMEEVLRSVRTGGVAEAARDDGEGRFSKGQAVGYVDDELVAWGAPEETLRQVLARISDGAELVTCIAGERAPVSTARLPELVPAGVELECSDGGQPSWWWLLSAE